MHTRNSLALTLFFSHVLPSVNYGVMPCHVFDSRLDSSRGQGGTEWDGV
jgi:hypothetical protein